MTRRLLLFVGLVLLLGGCAPFSTSPARTRTTLNWFINVGSSDWFSTLDPATVADPIAIADLQLIHAGLVRLALPGTRVVPDLATWTVSSDRRVWTFHIRARARFSNGDPVTAEDAAWSLTRALLPSTKSTVALTYLGHITGASDVATGKSAKLSGVQVLGPRTLRVTLDAPVAYFLAALSYPTGAVLDKRILAKEAPDTYVTSTCRGNVGAGPFRLVCRDASSTRGSFYAPSGEDHLDFEPNPYYYGPHPRVRIHAPLLQSEETAWARYRAGTLDAVRVPSPQWGEARRMAGFVERPALQTDFITPDLASPPFSNVNCRLAVAYAVNRDRATRVILHGMERPLYGVVPAGLSGFISSRAAVPHYAPGRALHYLAGCPGRLSGVTVSFDRTSPDLVLEYQAIVSDLRAIGAGVTARPLPFHSWLTVVGHPLVVARPPVLLLQNLWVADYPDPQDWCDTLLRTGGNFDISGFSDPQYDRLVDMAAVEEEPGRRAELYREAQMLALDRGAMIPVGQTVRAYMVSPHVRGIEVGPYGVAPRGGDWSKVTIVP